MAENASLFGRDLTKIADSSANRPVGCVERTYNIYIFMLTKTLRACFRAVLF